LVQFHHPLLSKSPQ